MLIDCDTCAVREVACADCVVSALLGPHGGPVELDSAEQYAIGALAIGGLLPPLRLVPAVASRQAPVVSHGTVRPPTADSAPSDRTAIA